MPDFTLRTLDQLTLEDEPAFRHVGLYHDLKGALRRDAFAFRVLPPGPGARWDRALLLNLTFWAESASGDILVDDHIAADVVTHAAWHHLAAKALLRDGKLSAEALLLGEAIASAFDVYLVGRLLGRSPDSEFLETQVPAMADAADAAGLSERDFAALLADIEADPDRAFTDLRALLYDVTLALFRCKTAREGLRVLGQFEGHRFAPLLHRYELSNWVLSTRVHTQPDAGPDLEAQAVDAALRVEKEPLEWLWGRWGS
jgi:hypothetical protein